MFRKALMAMAVSGLFAVSSFAATKTYQVTGPVTSVNNDSIVVQKGKEKWEIAKDAATKGTAGVKTGDKVTVEYKMVATNVEEKAPKKK